MQATSPLSLYQQMLARKGNTRLDDVQARRQRPLRPVTPARGKCLGKGSAQRTSRSRIYNMWGGVGRGKTWLMDLFYRSLPGERKLPLHFH